MALALMVMVPIAIWIVDDSDDNVVFECSKDSGGCGVGRILVMAMVVIIILIVEDSDDGGPFEDGGGGGGSRSMS